MASEPVDVPPPPYTATDIYSVSGGAHSPSHHTHSHGSDDMARSTTSSSGDVIYTPPLTPRSSRHSSHDFDNHVTTASAEAYFESRPAPPLPRRDPIVHSINARYDSAPEDFPYPSDWASRDVTLQDWQTFVNHLIPQFAAENNSQIIDRKLQAEGSLDDTQSQGSGRSHAKAQLNQIRTPIEAGPTHFDIDATVNDWNHGFFAARGIHIRRNPSSDNMRIPGAWNESADRDVDQNASGPSSSSRGGFFSRFRSGDAGGRGLRFGGLVVNDDGVYFGPNMYADRRGAVRIGSFLADSEGIRINEKPILQGILGSRDAQPSHGHHGRHGFHGFRHGPGPFGFHEGHHAPGFPGPGPFGRGSHDVDEKQDQERCDRHGGRGQGRGRGRHRQSEGRQRHRSRSSSTSSSSSNSSSSSVSSVGSLPDYDHMNSAQLPVARSHLQQWLDHPDQPVTKEQVKQVREQIKAAKRQASSSQGRINESVNIVHDQAALRREVKQLMRQWKGLKREQRAALRQSKRERRAVRKTERRERKAVKRELRKAKKDVKREWKRGGDSSFIPGAYRNPPARHGVSIPSVPSAPHAPYGGQASRTCGSSHAISGQGPFGGWRDPFGRRAGFEPASSTMDVPRAVHPGSWPGEADEAAARKGSQLRYKAVEDLELEVDAKTMELMRLHEQIAREQAAGEAKVSGREKQMSQAERTAQEVGTQLDGLTGELAKLRLEADAEFARELAEEEARQH